MIGSPFAAGAYHVSLTYSAMLAETGTAGLDGTVAHNIYFSSLS